MDYPLKSNLTPRLPGVSAVGYIFCRDLQPGIMESALAGMPVAILAPVNFLNIFGESSLKISSKVNNRAPLQESTLKFSTADEVPEWDDVAFIVKTVAGEWLLVGSNEPRYPVVQWEETTGQRTGEAAARTYTVTHIARRSVVRVIA